MIEPLGCPHPDPLPAGEGDKYRLTDCFHPYPGTYRGVKGECLMGRLSHTAPAPCTLWRLLSWATTSTHSRGDEI
jgi:hypothetical protein